MVQVDAESENRVSANSLIHNCIYIWMRREWILPSFVITNWSFWQKKLRNVGSCVCETMKWQYRLPVIIEISVINYSK